MKEAELLYEALNSEYGIEVEFLGNFDITMQRLHLARRKDPDLECIQISRSPEHPRTHVWLVKRDMTVQGSAVKQNPQGDGPLFSLADLTGDD